MSFFVVAHFDELKNFESGLLAVGILYFTIPVCLALSVLRYTTYLFRQSILEMSSLSVINFCLCELWMRIVQLERQKVIPLRIDITVFSFLCVWLCSNTLQPLVLHHSYYIIVYSSEESETSFYGGTKKY